VKHNRTLCQPTDDQNFIQYPNQRFYFYPKVLDICSVVSRMHIFFCLSNFILNFLFELPQFTHTESKYLSPFDILVGEREGEGPLYKNGKTKCFKLWDTS
jgi:hypothetical protein